MKIIYEPTVYVASRQVVTYGVLQYLDDHGYSNWSTNAEEAAERLCEVAGRVCYQSFDNPRPGGNKAYLEHIIESQHGSVLEHAVWSVLITGVSRSLTHELIRHRAGVGVSELSQRYVDADKMEFVVPPDLIDEVRKSEEEGQWDSVGDQWVQSCANSVKLYDRLTNSLAEKMAGREGLSKTDARKAARQAARSVLPNCTETHIFITANARAWRNIIEQRGSRHADAEIRRLANVLLDVLQREAPTLFGDYERTPLADGTFEITTTNRKV